MDFIYRLQGISLKWKLLIPFLLFAFLGTSILTLIGLTSQQNLIRQEEKKEILHHYRHFMERMRQRAVQAISLATMVAESPEVQKLLAERNKIALSSFLSSTYLKLKQDFNIKQFHFHIPPVVSFLRLHEPEKFGDDIGLYRKAVLDALRKGQPSAALERGVTGFGIRGVAPVFYEKKIVGSVGIGHSFGKVFLEDFYRSWDVDIALYDIKGPGQHAMIASAGKTTGAPLSAIDFRSFKSNAPSVLIAPDRFPDRSILFGPVKDYSGNVVALIRLSVDRSEIKKRLARTKNLMLGVGLAGIAISFLFTYLVIVLFIRPIKEIVREAEDIALEKRESRLAPRPNDEIGSLTQTLNTMLEALKKRRIEIEHYAKTLEKRVQERTADLVASEDKYRTLVENVPLVVYRVLRDGTTEFVNSYMTERLGYTIEEVVSDKRFWRDKISGGDLSAYNAINTRCFIKGEDCRVETRIRAKNGRFLEFITHAIPAKDSNGHVMWVDGIMMDITELKKLQERALQAEELRTLGEISASMAHEIRNPLSTAGGFARRLNGSLKDDDPNKRLAGIIVEEVAKLEDFLKTLLSSIKPFNLVLSLVDVNDILKGWIEGLKGLIDSRNIEVVENLDSNLPRIQADKERLSHAFENILKHAIISTPEGESISISTVPAEEHIVVLITHMMGSLSVDDMEKFFFPHIEGVSEWTVEDLPLSKIIIHRHGGIVNLVKEEGNILKMRIEFPILAAEDDPE
ncbi:cache domain-containing protein [Thermodesulfobacteriota bacterium]